MRKVYLKDCLENAEEMPNSYLEEKKHLRINIQKKHLPLAFL